MSNSSVDSLVAWSWRVNCLMCVLRSVSGQTVGDGRDKHFVFFGHGRGGPARAAWHPSWGRILWRIHLDESFFCVPQPLRYLASRLSVRLSLRDPLHWSSSVPEIELCVFSQVASQGSVCPHPFQQLDQDTSVKTILTVDFKWTVSVSFHPS